jgi:hypothetical protein
MLSEGMDFPMSIPLQTESIGVSLVISKIQLVAGTLGAPCRLMVSSFFMGESSGSQVIVPSQLCARLLASLIFGAVTRETHGNLLQIAHGLAED